jgi:hypothetical protein
VTVASDTMPPYVELLIRAVGGRRRRGVLKYRRGQGQRGTSSGEAR